MAGSDSEDEEDASNCDDGKYGVEWPIATSLSVNSPTRLGREQWNSCADNDRWGSKQAIEHVSIWKGCCNTSQEPQEHSCTVVKIFLNCVFLTTIDLSTFAYFLQRRCLEEGC